MQTKQIQINHLIKTLAEQLRHAESFNGQWGVERERWNACKAASKTVADLEKLGVYHEDAFDQAEALNERLATAVDGAVVGAAAGTLVS